MTFLLKLAKFRKNNNHQEYQMQSWLLNQSNKFYGKVLFQEKTLPKKEG